MKITIAMYQMNNLGGIINHTENLGEGLQELGHEVEFITFKDTRRPSSRKYKPEDLDPKKHQKSKFDVHYYSQSGYSNYKTMSFHEDSIRDSVKYLASRDLIIWTTPTPTKLKGYLGNYHWHRLYDLPEKVKQVAIIHDGNCIKLTPQLVWLRNKINGFACVHPAAYNSAASYDLPRAMILNPQDVSTLSEKKLSYKERKDGYLSLCTYKKWKNVDGLVRSVPYQDDHVKIHAGGGLHQAYMVSKEKTRLEYFCDSKRDPDLPKEFDTLDKSTKDYKTIIRNGIRIWDRALDNGMDWRGYINTETRDSILKEVKCLVDPSWNVNYAKHGDHFNRVVVDAALQGAIPIAVNFGISTNEEGIGELFKPNENYVMIRHDMTPKQYAGVINSAMKLEEDHANQIVHNNYELCKKFDRVLIAQQYLDLAEGKDTGHYGVTVKGDMDSEVLERGKGMLREFYGFPEELIEEVN